MKLIIREMRARQGQYSCIYTCPWCVDFVRLKLKYLSPKLLISHINRSIHFHRDRYEKKKITRFHLKKIISTFIFQIKSLPR